VGKQISRKYVLKYMFVFILFCNTDGFGRVLNRVLREKKKIISHFSRPFCFIFAFCSLKKNAINISFFSLNCFAKKCKNFAESTMRKFREKNYAKKIKRFFLLIGWHKIKVERMYCGWTDRNFER